MLENNALGLVYYFMGMWIFCMRQYLSTEQIFDIVVRCLLWYSLFLSLSLVFFLLIILCSRFIFNNQISIPYNFPGILLLFFHISFGWERENEKKGKLLLIYQYFCSSFCVVWEPIAFSTKIFSLSALRTFLRLSKNIQSFWMVRLRETENIYLNSQMVRVEKFLKRNPKINLCRDIAVAIAMGCLCLDKCV